MRLLLDTHIALWVATERTRLKPGELDAIFDPDNEVRVSAVAIWELRIKWDRRFRSGQRKGPFHPHGLLAALHRIGLNVDPLTAEQCAAPLNRPMAHDDPFDQLLLVIAQETDAKLLTRDEKLRGHPLAYHPD